jgi:hypothetical protein
MIPAPAETARLAQRQSFVVGHRLQRRTGAAFRVPDRGLPFTECGQYGDRQPLQSAFPAGPFFSEYRLGI